MGSLGFRGGLHMADHLLVERLDDRNPEAAQLVCDLRAVDRVDMHDTRATLRLR